MANSRNSLLESGPSVAPARDQLGIDQALSQVVSRLDEYFSERVTLADAYGASYRMLWESSREAASGGKRIRPRLVLTAYHGFGGSNADLAVTVAMAFELLHAALLLHDDVIDGDTLRRGRMNVNGVFRADAFQRGAAPRIALRWGEVGAILAGDLLLHAATDTLARVDACAEVRERLLDIFDHGVFVSAAGELADVALAERLQTGPPALEEVLAMTEHKTAAYSIAGPLMSGAVLAGADDDSVAALAEFGRLVGIAFQLGDDLLGVFGSEDVTGKSIVSDLREGKETSLVAFARRTPHWKDIAPSLGKRDLSPLEASRVAVVLEQCGARQFVEQLLSEHVDAAISALDTPSVPTELASVLSDVAYSCLDRVA